MASKQRAGGRKSNAKRRLSVAFDKQTKPPACSETNDDSAEDSENEEFEIESIIEEKDGLFRVRWMGYASSDDTWEPQSNLSTASLRAFRRKTTKSAQTDSQKRKPSARRAVTVSRQQKRICQDTPASQVTCDEEDAPSIACELELAFVGRHVSFSPASEPWMSDPSYRIAGARFLTGIVSRERVAKDKSREYEIRWESTQFQSARHVHYIPESKVLEGFITYNRMSGHTLESDSWESLCRPYHEAQFNGDIWDDFEEIEGNYARFEDNERMPQALEDVEQLSSMDFHANASLEPPGDLFVRDDGSSDTKILEKFNHMFECSAVSSFLAYLPISFWRKVVENTNAYNESRRQLKVTLDEMMKFLGVLFYMSLIDKGEYKNYWGQQVEDAIFGTESRGLETVMSLKRFEYIRQNLCFRHGVNLDDLKKDPAARIRPLINMLKLRSSKFVDIGRNCAVDETSIACRSRYARHLIVYNATKPTGKYHFKIYMCCCASTWLAVNFRLHCSSTITERLAGVLPSNEVARLEAATQFSAEVRKHVIEVTRPLHFTNRVVNTDNFYTSCQLLESMRLYGLYCRGTVRENSKHFPRRFMISKKDKMPRGSMKQGVNLRHGIVAASWVDGSVVNIVSNADPSTTSSVERLMGPLKVGFTAPTAVLEYNQAMQGVDRFDQLRSRFSVADGHTFRKWHKKLAMAFIDIAKCNAYITRKMTGAMTSARDPHRQFVKELITGLLDGSWRRAPNEVGLIPDAPINLDPLRTPAKPRSRQAIHQVTDMVPALPTLPACRQQSSRQQFPKSRRKRACIVCRLEDRYPTEITNYCSRHNVALCSQRTLLNQQKRSCARHLSGPVGKSSISFIPRKGYSPATEMSDALHQSKEQREKAR